MISKYNGTCVFCKNPTTANVDQYDMDTKKSYHEDCRDRYEQTTGREEANVLADRLGFCCHYGKSGSSE